jgi:DNA-binding ferritin-like protein
MMRIAGDILTDADLQQALETGITFKLQSRNCHWHIKTINMMH